MATHDEIDPSFSMVIRTVQSSTIKTLVEALKEIITDVVVDITTAGVKIIRLDSSHVVLIHLRLDATKFDVFYTEGPRKLGINMLNFHKIIKTINSNDALTLFMKRNDNNHLGIEIENREKQQRTTFMLNLLDMDNDELKIPSTEFNRVIKMPSVDLQKVCRDMFNLADYVEIKTINKEFILSCKGDFCSQETILCDSEDVKVGGDDDDGDEQEIVQGVFNLKYLVLFTKCTNLSKTVDLYLKNDYPLIVKYEVASLGEIKMCLVPQSN